MGTEIKCGRRNNKTQDNLLQKVNVQQVQPRWFSGELEGRWSDNNEGYYLEESNVSSGA